MSLQTLLEKNRIKSFCVLLTYLALFFFIGLLIDIIRIDAQNFGSALFSLISFQVTPTFTLCMGIIAILIIFYSITNFSFIMLQGDIYKELNPAYVMSQKEKKIYQLLQDLIQRSDLDFTPKLYIIEAPYMNAFASGWNEKNSLIALTTKLIDQLEESELQAVIAHELSHIRHGDIRLTMCVGILSNIFLFFTNCAVFYFLRGRHQDGANKARMILLVLQFILPIFTFLLQMYLSRSREYMADSGAAYLMQNSSPMIKALQKISQDYQQNDYSQIDKNPTRQAAYIFSPETLSTHPSIANRIQALLGKHYD